MRIKSWNLLTKLRGFYCRTKTVCRSAGWRWQYADGHDDEEEDGDHGDHDKK